MKRIFTFLLALLFLSYGKVFSQSSCRSLGCAAAQTGIVVDGTSLPDIAVNPGDPPGSCYAAGGTYKQLFWEFFFSPSGGDFVQGFQESSAGNALDLDYSAFDMGTTPPTFGTDHCPVSIAGWGELACNFAGSNGVATGPGQTSPEGSTLTTTAGHYYAICIIMYQAIATSFDATAPTLGGNPLDATNCATAGIILPVKLSSFTASVNNCAVNLNWASANENGLESYEVQSSSDGKNFSTIGTVAGSSVNEKYSYQQTNPLQGKLYYRLKMVDLTGAAEYSSTIAMRLDCNKTQVVVYPNPVNDILNVNITNPQNKVTIAKLFDINGKLVYINNMISGTNTVSMTPFAKGMYMLQLITGTDTQTFRINK